MSFRAQHGVTAPTLETPVHVLVTTDTLSGVWTYTQELVTGLVSRGVRVTLVSLGDIPLPQQTSWMDDLQGLEYRPTAFRLDWMQEAEQDLQGLFRISRRAGQGTQARPATPEPAVLWKSSS